MSANETYRVAWPGETPNRNEFLESLPQEPPADGRWEQITNGQFACRWERLESDMARASRTFPDTPFTVTIRDARHTQHHFLQHFQDGTPGERRKIGPEGPAEMPRLQATTAQA